MIPTKQRHGALEHYVALRARALLSTTDPTWARRPVARDIAIQTLPLKETMDILLMHSKPTNYDERSKIDSKTCSRSADP